MVCDWPSCFNRYYPILSILHIEFFWGSPQDEKVYPSTLSQEMKSNLTTKTGG